MHKLLLTATLAHSLILSIPFSDCMAAYVISPIATSNVAGGFGMSIPSINNNGDVAFISTSWGGGGIYVGSGGPLAAIVTSSTLFRQYGLAGTGLSLESGPIINDSGAIAFWASTTGAPTSPAVLLATPGGVTSLVSGPPPVGTMGFTSYSGAPQISNQNDVVFSVSRVGGFPGAGVFIGSGGPLVPIVSTDTEIRALIDPAISPNGVVAYEWKSLNQLGGPTADNLYTLNNGVTTLIATTPFSFFDYVAVNDSGMVAATSLHAIQMGNGGPLVTVADTSGLFSGFGAVSINNSNDIAFLASRATGGSGIFTGPDPVLDKIIAAGDSLLGSTISRLGFGRRGLNNSGQIVFLAQLENGHHGVFVATPVPEPTSLVSLSSGALILMCACYVRRRSKLRAEQSTSACSPS